VIQIIFKRLKFATLEPPNGLTLRQRSSLVLGRCSFRISLSRLRFVVVFFTTSMPMPEQDLDFRHNRFLPSPFQSESELLYHWRFIANQFILTTSPLRLTTSNFIFRLNTCRYSPYTRTTSSLTIGWVCRLQLLLVLASAVIFRSESSETDDHILLSQIGDSPNLEGQVPIFISLRNRVARLYAQAPGSIFVASYDSQGYGGGIRPRLHTGSFQSFALTFVK
jgi:hypothetical protein